MASKRKTRNSENPTDILNGRTCSVSLDKNLLLKAGSESKGSMKKGKKTISRQSKGSKRQNTDSDASGSDNSEIEEKERKTQKQPKRATKTTSKGSKRTKKFETDSEESEEEEKKRQMSQKKLGRPKKMPPKRKQRAKKLETDSEESEEEKSNDKKKKRKMSEESEDETSGSESSGAKRKRRLDKKEAKEESMKARLLACKVCKEEFKLYAALLRHEKVHNTLNYKCILCGERFEYRTAYGNHMKKEHTQVDAFPCGFPECEESCKTQKKLRDHEKSHLKYMCRFCKRGFVSKRMRNKHIENIHF